MLGGFDVAVAAESTDVTVAAGREIRMESGTSSKLVGGFGMEARARDGDASLISDDDNVILLAHDDVSLTSGANIFSSRRRHT
eukprot:COSAG02_NODE_45824_length_354_cov_0.227451_1_plen_83_part_00